MGKQNAPSRSGAQVAAAHSIQGKSSYEGSNALLDSRCQSPPLTYYALLVVAGLVHLPHEELQADNGVDDDDEEHEEGNVQQGHHGLDDGVQDHLETCATKASTVASGSHWFHA